MKTRIYFIAIIVMCFLPGCKPLTENNISDSSGMSEENNSERLPVCKSADGNYICIDNRWYCLSDDAVTIDKDEKYCGGVALSAIVPKTESSQTEPDKVYDDENAFKVLEIKFNQYTNDREIKIQNEKDNSIKTYFYEDEFYDYFVPESGTITIDPTFGDSYECHYGHWVCYSKEGCSCFNGLENKQIGFGDICENVKSACVNRQQPPAYLKYNSMSSGDGDDERLELEYHAMRNNADICLDDSCPCGDGACMKYGICDDGVCKCGQIETNRHDEFLCTMYYHYEPIDACSEHNENGGILICSKPDGCHTRDGRHFPQWATIGKAKTIRHAYAGHNEDDEALKSHIDAGFDTTLESTSIYGECVIDRKDGLKRMALASGSTSFVCDSQVCSCGNESCRLGEICENGKCRKDDCKAHSKNDKWCDLDIDEGICRWRYFEEKIYVREGENVDNNININEIEKDENGKYYYSGKEFFLNPGTEFYSGIICEGGRRYCHGRNNDPIPAPDKAEGYQCLEVTSLPGIGAKEHLKSWVCMAQNGCACGESQCKYGDSCIDEKCLSNLRPVAMCAGKPLQDGYGCIGGSPKCLWDTCVCGNAECHKGEYCSNSRCFVEYIGDEFYYGDVKPMPVRYPIGSDGKFKGFWQCKNEKGCLCNGKRIDEFEVCRLPCYGDGKLDEKGCWCGDKKLNDMESETCLKQNDGYRILCNNPEGCACGNTKCPMTTYCSKKQCMDPLTGQEIGSSSEKLEPVTSCHGKSCTCGPNTCQKGQFCLAGMCKDKIYSIISDGKRTFYDMNEVSEYSSDRSFMNLSYYKNLEKYTFHEIQSGLDVGNGNEAYIVIPEVDCWVECGTGCDESLTIYNRCALPSGCTCGSDKCSYGSSCINDKCVSEE